VERETVDLKSTNTSIQAAPRSNTTWSHPAANAVLTATIRASIHHLDHRPYLGEISNLANLADLWGTARVIDT
jgi:hypothetical protein